MPWAQGQSGNPKGRVAGSGKVDKLRAALAEGLPEVMNALLAQAKGGDTAAIKLVLERCIPTLRPMDAVTTLILPTDGGLADQGRAVLAALATGQLPVNQATSILQALAGLARLVELDELEKRVSTLENKP